MIFLKSETRQNGLLPLSLHQVQLSRFLLFLEGLNDIGYLLQLSFESLEKLKVLPRYFNQPIMPQYSEHIEMRMRAGYRRGWLAWPWRCKSGYSSILWPPNIDFYLNTLSPGGPVIIQVLEIAFCSKIPNFIQICQWCHEGFSGVLRLCHWQSIS